MLAQVKHYIREREQVSADDIALHFDVDLETVFGWMDYLLANGMIQRIDPPSCSTAACGGCAASGPGQVHYRWLGRRVRPFPLNVES
ncbi:FeoC like transcriptional regulator [Sulfurivirga caldicuralii]|uniref:FeoC like transcriptional regulator n=1 Tax=Sulfurivirga caldicuralii TaxID=364032 RepID=A0A1N6GLW2_9GAMM|nr:FeoC-like transcriptional regulator [Sulfurivirga caldicuralii]SIO08477.1 FeoC like transcriptional regulator [Sulfurivirga caldicuralii]